MAKRSVTPSVPTQKIPTARGGQQKKLHEAELFTEERQARPGQWLHHTSSRVERMRYDFGLNQVQVEFRDGTPWVYEDVPKAVWDRFRRTVSPGRFINHTLDQFPYRRGPDGGWGL